jgi:hypothetical protein
MLNVIRCFMPVFLIAAVMVPLSSVHAGDVMAQFDEQGALLLPTGYRTWVYVGGSVTPNEMNNGKAAFPEFHNTYIDPRSFELYKKNGMFPEGTILIKETVSVGSKQSLSGKGYFMGDFTGLYAEVKDAKRFPDEPDNWAFFSFTPSPGELPLKKATAHKTSSCSDCHQAGGEERVFTQYYPVLGACRSQH